MIFNKNKRFAIAVFTAGLMGVALQSEALPNVSKNKNPNNGLLRTAAACQPATNSIDLDINNVRAHLMTGGDMWWNIGLSKAAYEVPKGGGASSLFAGSCWIGGYDKTGQLKVAAQTYRQDGNDYWPGALEDNATISGDDCSSWDRFWKIDKSVVLEFVSLSKSGTHPQGARYDVLWQWPARGNEKTLDASGGPFPIRGDRDYAPFIDNDGDGKYDPNKGDYPDINGDQFIWWVFNDAGNVKAQSQTASIGLEVQASAFAYATNDALNNATFYNYRVINRGPLTLDSAFIATWSDADLGWAFDDYIGCDTTRGLGILYNGDDFDGDGGPGTYGSRIPMVGVDFFKGPKKQIPDPLHPGKTKDTILTMTVFDYYNNDFTDIGNPSNGLELYNYMTGSLKKGERFSMDWNGSPGSKSIAYGKGPLTKFVFYGDPEPSSASWSECVCGNLPYDRRFVHSSGPFVLASGDFEDITIGAVWTPNVGGCPNTSFKSIRSVDDQAQALFDNNFKTLEGPEAPHLVVRELDRKLVFYLENDPSSNNYKEQFGYRIDSAKYRSASVKAKNVKSSDSLYKFEGYRVFQLANSSVTPAQIFSSATGEVDPTMAKEVFSCDIKNGITKIVNYTKRPEVSDTTYIPSIKVIGKDSGIAHSFALSQDLFSKISDKNLINYHTYYFVAIAYAYNNFKNFDPIHVDSTQDVAYLGSNHGAGNTPLAVVVAMPNPANGDMGSTLNSDYGSGVSITRIEGVGNGGNEVEMDTASELAALNKDSGYIALHPTYLKTASPVGIKVIDPIKLVAADWQLFISTIAHDSTTGSPAPGLYPTGAANSDANRGLLPDKGYWMLIAHSAAPKPDTIYSEQNLSVLNEQILDKYGISVKLGQVKRPGDDQVNGNGYISSSVVFADSSLPWLAGVQDQSGVDYRNWLRVGKGTAGDTSVYCDFYPTQNYDTMQFYGNMLNNNSLTQKSWGPYSLGAILPSTLRGGATNGSPCGFTVTKQGTEGAALKNLFTAKIVITSDMSKWSKCLVLEQQEDSTLAEGKVPKFGIRGHAGWTKTTDAKGQPVYSTDPNDNGMSWFPGYAINEETGERVNIIFGEDSWLRGENGADMIWNPSRTILNPYTGDVVFGGKHYIYVMNTRYDGDSSMKNVLLTGTKLAKIAEYQKIQWVGVPLLAPTANYLPLNQGLIPTDAIIRLNVNRPYALYHPSFTPVYPVASAFVPTAATNANINQSLPYYTFTTKGLAPTPVSDATDKGSILDRIKAVPNPYYGQSGYENNRLDTRVRIINLPAKATITIYSLDGTVVRTLSKSDPNVSYIDWDIRNSVGLTVASGMYLMHVKADGLGETVIRWFGAMRPIDITQY